MKTSLFPLLVSLIAVSSAQAGSGGTRGGGRALVCRDAQGKISSARMLDVLEGLEPSPIGYSLVIRENQDAAFPQTQKETIVDHLITRQMEKLNGLEPLRTGVLETIAKIRSEKVMEELDTDLILPEDVGQVHLVRKPRNCKFEGAGVYLEDGRLHVNPEIYAAMDTTNQAAFFVHEGVYAFLREMKSRTAKIEESRQYVSRLRAAQIGPQKPIVKTMIQMVQETAEYKRRYETSEVARKITAEFASDLRKISFDLTQYQRILVPTPAEPHPENAVTFEIELRSGKNGKNRASWWLSLHPRSFGFVSLDAVDRYHGMNLEITQPDPSTIDYFTIDGSGGWINCDRKKHTCFLQTAVLDPTDGSGQRVLMERIDWDPHSGNPPVISAQGLSRTLIPVLR